MWTLRSERFLKISGEYSEIIAEIIVDTADELPETGAISGRILHQGSMAYVVKSGGFYVLAGDGEWCKVSPQPEPTYAKDYEYEITENSVTIKKYIGSAKNIAVPTKIEGLTVTKIGSGAFTGTAVEAVKIPEGAEEIE